MILPRALKRWLLATLLAALVPSLALVGASRAGAQPDGPSPAFRPLGPQPQAEIGPATNSVEAARSAARRLARLEAAGLAQDDDPYETVDQCVIDEMDEKGVPGASIAVALNGEVVYTSGYGVKHAADGGEIDAETAFRIGSTTKMMTAAAVMQQVEAGNVDLQAPVTDYVPEFELADPWSASDITPWHLLTHSSGFPDRLDALSSDVTLSEWAVDQSEVSLHVPPGSFWNYTNPGFSLAGLVAERASGMPYAEYMTESVWGPAGMPLTTLDGAAVVERGNYTYGHDTDPETGAPIYYTPDDYHNEWAAPAGFAFSTPTEMVRWAQLLMDGGGDVLSTESVAEMQSAQIATDYRPTQHYGYGIFRNTISGLEVLDHGGNINGWSSQLWWVPERDFAVSVLANRISALRDSAACAMFTLLDVEPPTNTGPVQTEPETWDRFTGEYPTMDYGLNRLTTYVERADDALTLKLGDDGTPITMTQVLTRTFVFPFDIDGDGVPDVQFDATFIDDDDSGTTRWLRNRYFVGDRDAVVPTPEPTATPGPTPAPEPVYLPVTVRDPACEPVSEHIDVIFVLEVSGYTLCEKASCLRNGKRPWDAMLDMTRTMLEQMRFQPGPDGGYDQAGVVVYRHRRTIAEEDALPLVRSPQQVLDFLDGVDTEDPSDTNRPDVGFLRAHDLLVLDSRHRQENERVIVWMSELQAKNVPYENVPGCGEDSDENCAVLKIANDVKGPGITFVVLATSDANRGGELLAAASDPSLAYVLPTPEQIAAVYDQLAPFTPCPSDLFWPYGD